MPLVAERQPNVDHVVGQPPPIKMRVAFNAGGGALQDALTVSTPPSGVPAPMSSTSSCAGDAGKPRPPPLPAVTAGLQRDPAKFVAPGHDASAVDPA